jgi:hypothetical protein
MPKVADGISVSPETLMSKYQEIQVIDEKIAAASGSQSAGKRAIANRLIEANQETVDQLVSQVAEYLKQLDDASLAGVFSGVVKNLSTQFDEKVNTYLTAEAEARKSEQPEVSQEELTGLVTDRKRLSDEYKALRNILEMFGSDVSGIPEPKKMTGARGPRGKRAISMFQFAIDGANLSVAENSLSKVAEVGGFEASEDSEGKKVTALKQLKAYLKENYEFDTSEPPDTFSFKLPNGKVFSGVKFESTGDEEDEEEEASSEEE